MENYFSNIKGVVFDFDGTLYNPEKFKFRLVCSDLIHIHCMMADRMFRKQNKGRDFGSCENFQKDYISYVSAKTGKSRNYVSLWKDCYMHAMTAVLRKKYSFRKNSVELFDLLKARGIKTAIYSDYSHVRERLDALGLINLDCGIFDSESIGCLKPNVRAFNLVADELGLRPDEILFVGDRSDTDGIGAISAGMKFILIADKTGQKKNEGCEYPVLSWKEFTALAFSRN